MKVHSTNYHNAFIQVSADCKTDVALVPTKAGSVAALQYDLLTAAPYQMTSDDLLVAVTGRRKDIPDAEYDAPRDSLFSTGQPCLRTSPLVKTYGWGVHHDAAGRIALVGLGTADYATYAADDRLKQVFGMRSKRA